MKYYKNKKRTTYFKKETERNQRKFLNSKKIEKDRSESKRNVKATKPNNIKNPELQIISFIIQNMKKNQNEEKKSKKDKNICSSKQIKENNENHNKKTEINETRKIEINPTQKKTQNKKRTKD